MEQLFRDLLIGSKDLGVSLEPVLYGRRVTYRVVVGGRRVAEHDSLTHALRLALEHGERRS